MYSNELQNRIRVTEHRQQGDNKKEVQVAYPNSRRERRQIGYEEEDAAHAF